MTHGIVVDHKESQVRYAIFEENFDEELHTRVRDLEPGETVLGFTPLRKEKRKARVASDDLPDPESSDSPSKADNTSKKGTE